MVLVHGAAPLSALPERFTPYRGFAPSVDALDEHLSPAGNAALSRCGVSPVCLSVAAPSAAALRSTRTSRSSLLTGRIVSLHVHVVRPAAAFRRDPDDVLSRVLDVARLAVHAVLRVDL